MDRKGRSKRARKRKPNHPHQRRVTRPPHVWRTRRKEQLWESDITKAARLALNDYVRATVPSMEEMVDFWTPILMARSREIEPEVG